MTLLVYILVCYRRSLELEFRSGTVGGMLGTGRRIENITEGLPSQPLNFLLRMLPAMPIVCAILNVSKILCLIP